MGNTILVRNAATITVAADSLRDSTIAERVGGEKPRGIANLARIDISTETSSVAKSQGNHRESAHPEVLLKGLAAFAPDVGHTRANSSYFVSKQYSSRSSLT